MSGNRAAIYRRVSTVRQSGDDRYSLPDQLERCTEHARSLGFEVVRDFCEVHSGAELDQRPEMTSLREAVRKHEIEAVISTKLDRLARDQIHQSVLVYEFEKHNVLVSLVDEQFEDTPSGRFMRSARGFLSEMERELIKDRTANGRNGRVQQGKMIPSRLPLYGYRWADEKKSAYEINEETALVVRRIFADIAAGKSMHQIARDLTEDGIPTPGDYWRQQIGKPSQGKAWAKSTLFNLTNNPAYWGMHTAFRYDRRKRTEMHPATGQTYYVDTQKERKIGEKRVLLPDAAPALISAEVAEAVKRRLAWNQKVSSRNNKHPEVALLRGGLAKCSRCGYTMALTWNIGRKDTSGRVPVYRCGRSFSSGRGIVCPGPAITVHVMDAAVWARAMHVLKHPETLREEAEKRMGDSGKQSTIEGYQKTVANLEAEEASLAEAIGKVGQSKGYGMDSLLAQLQKVGEKKEDARKKLASAESEYRSYQEVQQRLHDLEAWCHGVTRGVDELTYEEKRIVLFGLNTRVTVYPRDHIPRYHILMGNEEEDTLVSSEGDAIPGHNDVDCVPVSSAAGSTIPRTVGRSPRSVATG